MGTLTESFRNVNDYLLSERKKSKSRSANIELISSTLLKPYLPSAIHVGPGTVTDIKDRQAGPFDAVACVDLFPPFSEGSATTYLADGVIFNLQIRNWAENDLTQFGELASQVKKLERKNKIPIPCLALSFDLLPLGELTQFLNSKAGQGVDGVVCIDHHVIIRNTQGWYGDPSRVPYVTERPGPEALKAFTFFLLQLAQTAIGGRFDLADYQHL